MEIRELFAGSQLHQLIILTIFLLSFLLQLGMYLFVFLKLPLYKPEKKNSTARGISVVICARNEEKNLARFLPLVLSQDYPEFEVVVVNDSSTDDTEQLLMQMAARFKSLRYTSIPVNDKMRTGKKLALTIGLKAAKYDLVLLTDADCYPVSDQWLNRMASNFRGNIKIVLGYGSYEMKKGFLDKLIRYETTYTAIQYLSFAIIGKPYMGVGRNLAYERTLFFDNKGFAGHYHLTSGDDDLFVNENASRDNCAVELSIESHTRSLPEPSFRSWIKQKKRHISAGSHYRTGSRIRLAGDWISRIFLYSTLIWISVSSEWRVMAIVLFGILLLVRLIIFKMGMRRLDEKYLLLPSLLFDPVLPFILGAIWFSSHFENKYQLWR